jgi:hypothetical protein
MSNIPAEQFDTLTKQFFGFLIDEYQFVLKKKNDLNYDFETATTRVSIYIEFNIVVVEMVPIGEEDRKLRQKNILPEPLGITVVARGVDPNFVYKVDWDEPLASSMERQSQVLKNYCKDFLAGDFTKWTDVLAAMRTSK